MTRNIKHVRLNAVIAVAALLAATSASAYTVTEGGTAAGADGVKTSHAGAITTDFNSSLVNPIGYLGGGVVFGDSSGLWATPPADITNYFSVGPSTNAIATISLGFDSDYFGYYGGSPDIYNSIELWNSGSLVRSFTGAELAAAIPHPADGNQSVGAYVNISASNASEYFDTIKILSTSNAFETDNHAVTQVPEPESYAMFMAGLGLMGFIARRRKNGQS